MARIKQLVVKADCREYKGSKPCLPNKISGHECHSCPEYAPIEKWVLIIKLDAPGDVLRSTCLLPKIKECHPSSYIVWITRESAFDLINSLREIDETWTYEDSGTHTSAIANNWDIIYNLDNSYESSALASVAGKEQTVGFTLEHNRISPTNDHAENWLLMGLFDRAKKENRLSYQRIMYNICDFKGPIAHPALALDSNHFEHADNSLTKLDVQPDDCIIGFNTGSGNRWPKKMPDVEQCVSLLELVLQRFKNSTILLLGGPVEQKKNREIHSNISSNRVKITSCENSLLEFAALLARCNALICGDTLALHMASALKIKTVTLIGPTSYYEIHDYNGLLYKIRSEVLDCLCCYGDCDKVQHCMSTIEGDSIIKGLTSLLPQAVNT